MTVMRELIDRVCRAQKPRRILLGPAQAMELLHDLRGLWHPGGSWMFMGLPVVMDMPGEFCRSCGAPVEPNVCSYCRTESTTISIEETA